MLILLLAACGPSYKVVADEGTEDLDGTSDTADTGEDEAELDELWADATLVVLSPGSGDFLPYGEAAEFEAVVYDAAGDETDFEEITWKSDVDGAWTPSGGLFEDDSLGVGTHALTATALLPNGDRLAYTVGGVLVQSPYAGIYVGTLTTTVTIEYEGTPYSVGCSGAATVTVDAEGEAVVGDADCVLALQGQEVELAFLFDLENDEGDLAGVATAEVYGYGLDYDATGAMDDEDNLAVAFTGDLFGYGTLEGSLEATRVSRDVSE